MWRQLKRVSIPVFSDDKRSYKNWKATFTACIDQAPATPEYKLLQLRQYLSGEAPRAVEKLGHSALGYEAANEKLERKYGGSRRQAARYLGEFKNFRAIRSGKSKDLENFADLLDVAVIDLQDIGREDRAVFRALIGGVCIFIYSGSARLVSFEIKLISKDVSRAKPEYNNRADVRGHKYVFGPTQNHFKMCSEEGQKHIYAQEHQLYYYYNNFKALLTFNFSFVFQKNNYT